MIHNYDGDYNRSMHWEYEAIKIARTNNEACKHCVNGYYDSLRLNFIPKDDNSFTFKLNCKICDITREFPETEKQLFNTLIKFYNGK